MATDDALPLTLLHPRLIWGLAKKRRHPSVSVEDLYQEGQMGFLRAVQNYDPGRGAKLSTYAQPSVRWAIQRFVVAHRSPIRVTRHATERSSAEDTREMARAASRVLRLDAPLVGEERSLADVIADDAPTPEDDAIRSAERARAAALVAQGMRSLPPRYRDIIERRLLADDPETLGEIGEDTGVTREAVRRVEVRAVCMLRAAIRMASPEVGRWASSG